LLVNEYRPAWCARRAASFLRAGAKPEAGDGEELCDAAMASSGSGKAAKYD
jgi:hypothetical protein